MLCCPAHSQTKIVNAEVILNGKSKNEVQVLKNRNTVLFPLRYFGEFSGAELAWDAKSRRAKVVNKNGIMTELILDSHQAQYDGHLLNGKIEYIVYLGKLWVPLSFLELALDEQIHWDEKACRIEIDQLKDFGKDARVIRFSPEPNSEPVITSENYTLRDLAAAMPVKNNFSFTISFGKQVEIKKIVLIASEENLSAMRYAIEDVDFYDKHYSTISEGIDDEPVHIIDIPTGTKCSFMKVSISNPDGSAMCLDQIRILVPEYMGCMTDWLHLRDIDESILISGSDPNNPLYVWRQPIPKWLVNVANDCLDNDSSLTPHQKLMKFMNFIKDFRIGLNGSSSLEETILTHIGSCGDYTNIFLALAATQGIPGRIISLANYPQNYGHVVAEVWINGKWMVYDPTYSAYYTDTPEDTVNPNVLSFTELRNGRGYDPDVKCIVGNKARLSSELAYEFLGPGIYARANPAGAIGPDRPFIYPLTLDLIEKPFLSKDQYGTSNQGASYIGAAGICNMQKWTLTSLEPGKNYNFIVVPDWLGGELLSSEMTFTASVRILSGGIINRGETFVIPNDNKAHAPWVINFTALNDTVEVLLEHPYRGPLYRYLKIKEYKLEAADGEQ